MKRKRGNMSIVASLENDQDLIFVSNSQDTQAIREHVGDKANGYDAFFVKVKNADYSEVWGICGIIPVKSKLASRLV